MGSLNRGRTWREYAAGRRRARPWRLSDLFAECAFGLDEDGLVDRLHAWVHALIMRETHTQVCANLFWAPSEMKLVPDDAPQARIGAFARLWAFEALACSHVSNVRVVARGGNPITLQLSAHGRG